MYRKGFTLIELLVVISIIALLSSVVFASLNEARIKGRNARRMSDMRSLQTAIELYKQDHGGDAPGENEGAGSIYITTGNSALKTLLVGGGYISGLPVDPTGVDS